MKLMIFSLRLQPRRRSAGAESLLRPATAMLFSSPPSSPRSSILSERVKWRNGSSDVLDRYGVKPSQVADFIALRGDPSDKIPGAKGVGASTAASLLRKYGSLEGALAAGRFAGQADKLRLYLKIATMDRTAPLPKLRKQAPQWARASALVQEWGFTQLANRLKAT